MKTHAFFRLTLLYLSSLNTFIYIKDLIPKESVGAASFSLYATQTFLKQYILNFLHKY